MRTFIYLAEALTYRCLLTESQRADFLLKTYGAKIAARWTETKDQEPPTVQNGVKRQQGADDAQRVIAYIMSFDPSPNHKFSQWLVTRYTQGTLKLEDLSRAHNYLITFEKFKQNIEKRDINQYKSLPELFQAIQPFVEKKEENTSKRAKERALSQRMHKQATILLDTPNLKILIPKTKAASCYFGRNTEWCTAATKSKNLFKYYNDQGPLYIILFKRENRRYQYHAETSQFMDEHDDPVKADDLKRLLTEHPEIIQVLGYNRLFKSHANILGIDFFPKEIVFKLLSENPELLTILRHEQREILRDKYPDLIPSIGYDKFLPDIDVIGLKFFPEDVLIKAAEQNPESLVNAISIDDIKKLPERIFRIPTFMATLAAEKTKYIFDHHPEYKKYITPEVLEKLRELFPHAVQVFHHFPLSEWPLEAAAIAIGNLTFKQFKELRPEIQEKLTGKFLLRTAALTPHEMRNMPTSFIVKAYNEALKDNPYTSGSILTNLKAIEYLPKSTVSNEDILNELKNRRGKFLYWWGYIPQERKTPEFRRALLDMAPKSYQNKSDEQLDELSRRKWIELISKAYSHTGDTAGVIGVLLALPDRFDLTEMLKDAMELQGDNKNYLNMWLFHIIRALVSINQVVPEELAIAFMKTGSPQSNVDRKVVDSIPMQQWTPKMTRVARKLGYIGSDDLLADKNH